MGRGRASAGAGPPIQQAWAGKLVPTEPGRAWSASCCYTSRPQAKCPFLLNAPRTDNPDPKNSMYVLGDFCPCQASGGQRAGVHGTQRAERTTRGLQRSTQWDRNEVEETQYGDTMQSPREAKYFHLPVICGFRALGHAKHHNTLTAALRT